MRGITVNEVLTSFHGRGQSYRLVQQGGTHAEHFANLNAERILDEPLLCLCLDRAVWAFQIPDRSRQNRHQEMLSSIRKHDDIPRVLPSREGSSHAARYLHTVCSPLSRCAYSCIRARFRVFLIPARFCRRRRSEGFS